MKMLLRFWVCGTFSKVQKERRMVKTIWPLQSRRRISITKWSKNVHLFKKNVQRYCFINLTFWTFCSREHRKVEVLSSGFKIDLQSQLCGCLKSGNLENFFRFPKNLSNLKKFVKTTRRSDNLTFTAHPSLSQDFSGSAVTGGCPHCGSCFDASSLPKRAPGSSLHWSPLTLSEAMHKSLDFCREDKRNHWKYIKLYSDRLKTAFIIMHTPAISANSM